ncbi:MAG: FAD-dependent oxidoreductase [Alphaproteobacteria bacterium]
MKITRRHFLAGGMAVMAGLGLTNFVPFFQPLPEVSGEILGASSKMGHRLRGGSLPRISGTVEKDVVIIGGGIAGLGAAYRLHKAGLKNFTLLELENNAGGNAQSGKNSTSAYPWGAHYVPLLTEEARAPRKLFEELGIITGHNDKGQPIYNEYFLCSDPHERLFMYGRWQDGIVPSLGLSADDKKQYAAFFGLMEKYKTARGKDGKKAFAIPVDKSSQDPAFLKYDDVTIKEWMDAEGYTSVPLRWYINYCCRDDYGTTSDDTSAWAAMHYFAARTGTAANAVQADVVTWPEGNGWLAHKLIDRVKENILSRALVFSVKQEGGRVNVDYIDEPTGQGQRISAKSVVLATPQFIASRLTGAPHADAFTYSPWAVANITLSKMPEGKGMDLAWDNMIYNSKLLGYVVATHQNTSMMPNRTVITYYWPLSHLPPKEARAEALARKYEDWRDIFMKELLIVHPELKGRVESLDMWVWGHAMVRPTKGFIWGPERRAMLKQKPPVFHAHSDMSGISIFEEAYTRGVEAAEHTLAFHKIPYQTEL